MVTLTRWNPAREMMALRNMMDRVFEEGVESPAMRWSEATEWPLALDVVENKEGYMVQASLPGVNPDEIEIVVNDNVLTIKGQVKKDEPAEGVRYHVRERRYGTYSRSLTLPQLVNTDAVDANYHNGILSLFIPKAEEAKPKRIAIQTNGAQRTIVAEANH